MIFNALNGKPLPVYGDGLNVRDWLYVEDHCEAIATVLKHGKPGETYNIGGWNEKKNIDIVHLICDAGRRTGRAPRSTSPEFDYVREGPPRARSPLCHGREKN